MKAILLLSMLNIISMLTATAQTKGNYALVNGLNLYYEVHGEGSPLVLIHGGGSDIYVTFGRVLQEFAKSHKVIAMDLQAHGHTADRGKPTSFEQDADDVAALLRHLGIAKADVLGFSNGGTTALQLAIRHPQLVNKLVLASALAKKDGAYPWLWEFMKNATEEDMPPQLQEAFLAINPSRDALQTMHNRDAYRMLNFQDIPDSAISNIEASALIIVSDQDVIKPEHAVEMYRLMPNARLIILPGPHGGYLGELLSLQAGVEKEYPAVQMIEEFLSEPTKK